MWNLPDDFSYWCFRCRLGMTVDEVKESTEKNPTCRQCTQMQHRFRDFYEHSKDEEYFENNENVPEWEWWAYHILNDAQDTSLLVNDLKLMKENEGLTFEDYRKVIEILAKAFVLAQFDDSMQEEKMRNDISV